MCYKCGGVFESAELAQHMELCARSALVRCDNCQSKIRMADRAEHDKGCQTLTHCESCGELVRTLEFENHTFFCQKHEFTPFTKN
jgi:DNA-directed RNA polymerase subunit RPC12/RpoP